MDMKTEAGQFIKLLRLDDKAPEIARAKKTYFPAQIRSDSYPAWLRSDVPTLTVKAFLVTYDYNLDTTRATLVRFADALCANFDKLQAQGHPKWKEVSLALPGLGQGWSYYAPMEQRLRACSGTASPQVQVGSPPRRTRAPSKRPSSVCARNNVVAIRIHSVCARTRRPKLIGPHRNELQAARLPRT